MSKFVKSFKKIILPVLLACAFCAGGLITFSSRQSSKSSSADFLPTTSITNNLPDYVTINKPTDTASAVNYVDETIYLFQSSSYTEVVIGDDEIKTTVNENGEDVKKTNWAYIPEGQDKNDPKNYSYFNFNTALSLYYDKTIQEVEADKDNLQNNDANLLKDNKIEKFIHHHENSFAVSNVSSSPYQLKFKFKLDTTKETVEVTPKDAETKTVKDETVVTLNKEGIYTLAIPVIENKTSDSGKTFTSNTTTIYYNFMIFEAKTYFDAVSGKPNIDMSKNVQTSTMAASDTHSLYYFYNYAYATDANTLPKLTYDPTRFSISLEQNDLLSNLHKSKVEYQGEDLVQLDETGAALPKDQQFARVYLENGDKDSKKANIVFYDLGVYDFEFNYLYRRNDKELYNLHLEKLQRSSTETPDTSTSADAEEQKTTSVLQNKKQRLYIYGYQAEYSDLDDIDPVTNQPISKDVKTYNDKDQYLNQADITSQVNHFIISNEQEQQKLLGKTDPVPAKNDEDDDLKTLQSTLQQENPAKNSTPFEANTIFQAAREYILTLKPARTNQVPVKFINNAKISDQSVVYEYDEDKKDFVKEGEQYKATKFSGENQNNAGTYLYIVQYTYDYFLSNLGVSQSDYYHYQIFYFKVTNTTPTVTVLDSNFKEINTTCYTNKNVYILNDTESDAYDAKVHITLSAYDYNKNEYIFEDTDIENLKETYKIEYKLFTTSNSGENTDGFNSKVAGKYGILIDTKSTTNTQLANARYTIKISSANTNKPSVRTFTIDTSPIKNITSRNASAFSSTQYKIGETFTSYNTNQPFIMSWDEKASGAPTHGYVYHLPMTAINYYSELDESALSQLLQTFVDTNDALPVSYKFDFSLSGENGAKNWTEYFNTQESMTTIEATKVKTKDGFYILQVYDEAGNSEFKVFLIDSTAPIFVKKVNGQTTSFQLFHNGDCISIPEGTNTTISIAWTKNKLIKVENFESIKNLKSYLYGVDTAAADKKLTEKLTEFFKESESNNGNSKENFIKYENLNGSAHTDNNTGISDYKGTYLRIAIDDTAYVKDGKSDNFSAYTGETQTSGSGTKNQYSIKFTNESDIKDADNKTYQILLRDSSNTYLSNEQTADQSIKYRNYPSAFVSFNVTSDASKMMLWAENSKGEWESMSFASYSLEGDVYTYKENENTVYTHLTKDPKASDSESENTYTKKEGSKYKFSYYTPNKGANKIKLTYIPVASSGNESGVELAYVKLKYYPYERKSLPLDQIKNGSQEKTNKYGDKNYYFYYDLASEPSKTIDIFKASENSGKNYETGKEEEFSLTLDSGDLPAAGKYVIERVYKENGGNTKVGNYDYFMRTLTLIVDNKNLISPLENVSTPDEKHSSLESLVGGDIVLSLYSGTTTGIELSFPKYNEYGLSEGSFFSTSKSDFDEDDAISFAVSGNKLPISLYIPSKKYTEASVRNVDGQNKPYYTNYENKTLSYYGNAHYEKTTGSDGQNYVYEVYVEDVLVKTCTSEDEAIKYINSTVITEYQIMAKVHYTKFNGNKKEDEKFYRSNGTSEKGFLTLYEAASENAAAGQTKVDNFFKEGNYEVTIYQAYNAGTSSNFYTLYKFGFEIISQAPNFDVLGGDGNYLIGPSATKLYSNSPKLKVQWEVPTSPYVAKIDEKHITIKNNDGQTVPMDNGGIKSENNMKYFTIDTTSYVTENKSITITMQYEGHDSKYYQTITKTIHFDRNAPSKNLNILIDNTEKATSKTFSRNYQLLNMRSYYDFKNDAMTTVTEENATNASYSYSTNTGTFKYYSYNVTPAFFTETLLSSLLNNNDNKESQFIYYRYIDSLNNYNQVDKNSFAAGSYTSINVAEGIDVENLHCGFYEIVEKDYAGNMTVYLVQLTSSLVENDSGFKTDAITYTNDRHNEAITVNDSEIKEGYNIYSNSGFTISKLSYLSDAWGYYMIKRVNENDTRYMCSPWIDEGMIYKITLLTSEIKYETISLNTLFENIATSSQKHKLTLTDRIEGKQTNIYLTIMDPALSTQKRPDDEQNYAILDITVPTKEQVASTVNGYIFPVNVKIYQYNSEDALTKWSLIMEKSQSEWDYGNWTAPEQFDENNAVDFTQNNTLLTISTYLGAKRSQKIRYEILDNFGNLTTVIQLATEVRYQEITGPTNVYELPESNGDITYLASDEIDFSFNPLLYRVEILDKNNQSILNNSDSGSTLTNVIYSNDANTGISTYVFKPQDDNFYDNLYIIKVYDVENEDNEPIKTLYIRLYYKLPTRSQNQDDLTSDKGVISFFDKYQKVITEDNIGQITGYSVDFEGKTYTATAEIITTFSENVTIRFYDGQSLNYNGDHRYEDGYTYTVWLSADNGKTWKNINNSNSANSGYTISNGVGNYLVLVKYDSEEIFTNLCNIYEINILDSSENYYYVTVDGLVVKKSDVKYYSSQLKKEIEVNYIVSVDWKEKQNRLSIFLNEELNVVLSGPTYDNTNNSITVEVYSYTCGDSYGEFSIIYIAATKNIITTGFTYENSDGNTHSLIDSSSSAIIVAEDKMESNFKKLRLTYDSWYGIEANKINVEVTKLFNGEYVKVNVTEYTDGQLSYFYLTSAGSYRIKIYDSCSPANIQYFNNSQSFDLIFLSDVPFTVTNTDGENTTITEPIQKAVYNGSVTLKPTNISTYYRANGTPAIQVTRNGLNYKGFTASNNTYTFTEAGYYSVIFNATSTAALNHDGHSVAVRTEPFNFIILNKNESRYAFEYTEYSQYYIEKIERIDENGNSQDITENMLLMGNFPTITLKDLNEEKVYLAGVTINYLDEKTGGGHYRITVNPNDYEKVNLLGNNFTFEFWINIANPPISVSIAEGDKTTKNISVTFNVQNLYDAVGDCYIVVGDLTKYYTADSITTYGTTEQLTILSSGTYYIQLYTMGGHLLYSYKVVKTEPLNVFAIIAIIVGVIAACAVIIITIALRKKHKIK